MKRIACFAIAVAMLSTPALAADSGHDWSGFYVGAHAGYDWFETETNGYYAYDHDLDSWSGGIQVGYDHQHPNGIVTGFIADIGLSDASGSRYTVDTGGLTVITQARSKVEAYSTFRGRLGYAAGAFLPYLTGGIAWARQEVDYFQDFGFGFTTNVNETKNRIGWTVGAGLEYAISDRMSIKAEYLYMDLGGENYAGTWFGLPVDGDIDLTSDRASLGVNFRF